MRIAWLTTIVAIMPLAALGQEQSDMAAVNAAIETQRQVTEAERQIIVSQNLSLSASQSDDFWPLYRDYRADVAKLNDRFIALVKQYADSYETIDDKLQQRYANRFNKAVGGKNTARYLQIEARLDAIAMLKVRSSIPLVI
jgi:outer membrane PBP1 activator LpoA protein